LDEEQDSGFSLLRTPGTFRALRGGKCRTLAGCSPKTLRKLYHQHNKLTEKKTM